LSNQSGHSRANESSWSVVNIIVAAWIITDFGKPVSNYNMIMQQKRLMLVLTLVLIAFIALIGYSQSASRSKSKNILPVCDCAYANTKVDTYGVIRDGKCKVIKCRRKQKEK
jgi:hypothetical protein